MEMAHGALWEVPTLHILSAEDRRCCDVSWMIPNLAGDSRGTAEHSAGAANLAVDAFDMTIWIGWPRCISSHGSM